MQLPEAEVVLSALGEVWALDDVQEIVDRVCQCVARVCPFDLALLSLYFEEDVYIGLEGGTEELRRSFLESARAATSAQRAARRDLIWREHRIEGTNICFIPEGSSVPFGASFTLSEEVENAAWRPEDRLMVFVRGADNEVRGVLSLDRPVDGRRPAPENLGPLRAVDHLMKLMGVVIHNKHLAAKLRESEGRYASVVEQGHDGILIEREERLLFANHRLARMLGAAPADLINRPLAEVLTRNEEGSLPGEEEGQLLRVDGRPLDVAIRVSRIRFEGATANLVAVADITERKRILTELIRSQKMDSVGTLASGIAHDFNNLLCGILGYASLLRMGLDESDPALRYVDSIEQAADRAAGVTRQLLGIVRDEQVRVAPFAVHEVTEEVARLLRETIDPSIAVQVDVADDLPQVLGDATQIHQVLLNVCLNARDAMPNGGSLVMHADRGRLGGGPAVRVRVRDTGVGMDDETLARVFDPFFSTKEGGRGTGLGLYMAYRVVERHGGHIDIVSEPGHGTTVEILLPACQVGARARAPDPAGEAGEGAGTVLLVDDEEMMRQVGTEMLERLSYSVLTAADGCEAVDLVEARGAGLSCVVLDIAMPVMNGWEAARRIRRLHPDLPIVISSGHDVSAAMGDTHGIRNARYLKKPYRLEDLKAVLGAVISATSATP